MSEFLKRFMKDVPRGNSTRPLREQKAPQARWMRVREIANSKALSYDPRNPGKQILVGALDSKLIGIDDNRHILTVAGSRSGKSVTVIGNLFFYKGSVLATDPKGELAEKTAKARKALGQKICILDPFQIVSEDLKDFRKSYNPMAMLVVGSATLLEDCALLAESIVVQSADQKDPHWDESAKNFIEGVIVHVATSPNYKGQRNLPRVRDLITKALWTDPDEPTEKNKTPEPVLFTEMRHNAEHLSEDEKTADIGSALFGAAIDFYGKTGSELSGVQSTVLRHTKFLDYKAFKDVLRESDFTLSELKSVPKGVTVYLCFPATRVELSKRWMRIFVNQLLDAMEREKTVPPAPVLVCLDEFPVLGYMKQLETAAGLIASYHCKLWTILQDWNQGIALYKERWETFAGNAGIIQFFGNNDVTTTEYISKVLGKTQVAVTRVREVEQDQHIKGLSGRSEEVVLYDLMTPDEIRRYFSRSDQMKREIILWAGHLPMIIQRVEWHQEGGPLARYVPKT